MYLFTFGDIDAGFLESKQCTILWLTMIPQNYVDLTDPEVVKKFTRILDLLDEDDDVQAVYHNANLPDEE